MTVDGSCSETTNPYLLKDALPKFQSIKPAELTPALEVLIPEMKANFELLERKLQESKDNIDFDDVLPALERIEHGVDYCWGIAEHLKAVQNSDELRQQIERNEPQIVQTFSEFQQSRPMFDALTALQTKWNNNSDASSAPSPTVEQQRAVELNLLAMKLGGVGLDGEAKERFNEIKSRLAQLSTKFSNNVMDETKAFFLTVTDPKTMEGVPASARAMWRASYVLTEDEDMDPDDDDDDDGGADNGPWRITLDGPSYTAAMKHLRDRSLREQLYKGFVRRASENSGEGRNNIPIIYEMLQLRAEMAQLLGFANFAELSLTQKMAPSPEETTKLSDLIASKALPAAKQELAEVTAFARQHGGPEYEALPKLEPWDVTFWTERLKETKFELKEEDTRPYFALPAVLQGLFALIERLFNVKIVEGEAEVWHADVKFFKVLDGDSDKHIASFFLDPFTRPEDKTGGGWMNPVFPRSSAISRDIPVAYLVCNGSPPVGSKPSLMTFAEVRTLFHETGHGLQHMLTTATVRDVSGINGIEWDAVELPSLFMENWLFDKPTICSFAKHWETGDPIPDEMFEKLLAQKTFNTGTLNTRQLYYGQMDMLLHSSYDATKGASGDGGDSIFDVQRQMAEKYIPYNLPLPEDRFLCTFLHLFAGGYAAGYYGYKWAEVMSADAFSAFEEAGFDNEEQLKSVGRRFRETVLSLGGSKSAMQVFKEFRGREPNPQAMLRHNGLTFVG